MADTKLNYLVLPVRKQVKHRISRGEREVRRRLSSADDRNPKRSVRDHRPFFRYECEWIGLGEDEKNRLSRFWEAHQLDTNEPVSDSDAFLFEDDTQPREHDIGDATFGTGDDSTTNFSLSFNVAYEDRSYTRPASYIQEGSETIRNAGTKTTAYDIDYNTGVVTFDSAPADGNSLTADFKYHKKVIFETGSWGETLNGVKWDVSFALLEVQ